MPFTSSEKIRIILKRQNKTISDLARLLNTTQGNLSNKLRRDNLTENDLKQIAAALNCSIDFIFTDNETGETI